ncbi:hypothetical protein BT69DRAFT_1280022 [Atractiella rhizophila]|nr:hypothetical protein BT69DRAFT_1280022 [Atractiella rhizophila]
MTIPVQYTHSHPSASSAPTPAHLLPWSIPHDLPYYPQISQYFLYSAPDERVHKHGSGDFVGAFRGRRIVGKRYGLPKGMRCEVWDIREEGGQRNLEVEVDVQEVSMEVDELQLVEGEGSGLRRSSRKRAAVDVVVSEKPKKKARKGKKKNFSLSDDEKEKTHTAPPAPPIALQPTAIAQADVYAALRSNKELSPPIVKVGDIMSEKKRVIHPLDLVDHLVIWSPDVAVEEREDCFFKTLTEWTDELRTAVHDD